MTARARDAPDPRTTMTAVNATPSLNVPPLAATPVIASAGAPTPVAPPVATTGADALGPILQRAEGAEQVITEKLTAAEGRRDSLMARLRAGGDPVAIGKQLDAENALVKYLRKEQEKQQAIQALVRAVRLGVVPIGLVRQLASLGLASLAQTIVQLAVGNGKGLSKGVADQVRALDGVGVHVSILHEQFTNEGLRDAEEQSIRTRGINLEGVPTDAHGRPVDPSTGLPGQLARAFEANAPRLATSR